MLAEKFLPFILGTAYPEQYFDRTFSPFGD